MSNLPISEQWRLIAKQHAESDAAANLLEEGKSAFLARLMTDKGDMPVSRAEMLVKASTEWRDYISAMVGARQAAALLKVEMEFVRMRFSENQSYEANKRAEMRL